MTPAQLLTAIHAAGATIAPATETGKLTLRGTVPQDVIDALTTDSHLKAAVIVCLPYLEDEAFAQLQGRLWNGARLLWTMETQNNVGGDYARGLQLLTSLTVLYEELSAARLEGVRM